MCWLINDLFSFVFMFQHDLNLARDI